MLSNKYRLRSTKQIAEVFKTGKHVHEKYIFIKYVPNKQKNARIAISVSTKLFKRAVKRNRIKRLIREALKPLLSKLPNIDILVIIKPTIPSNATLSELEKDISNVLDKIPDVISKF